MLSEAANLAGFSQAGAPATMRGSTARPMPNRTSAASSTRLTAVRVRWVVQNEVMCAASNVVTVNIKIRYNVDNVNTEGSLQKTPRQLSPRQSPPRARRRGRAHDWPVRRWLADPPRRRRGARRVTNGAVSPFRRQGRTAGGG